MAQYDTYFHLTNNDVVAYVKEKQEFFNATDHLKCTEIGDGNINFIFRVENVETGESIIIKHAAATARVSGKPMAPTHNRIEAKALKLQWKYMPGAVPILYYYDPVMCCLFMEDLKGYKNFRYLLCEHQICERFADSVTDFLSSLLIRTTDNILLSENKRALIQEYANPEMCEITERLVFTDPFSDCHRSNVITPGNIDFVTENIYQDSELSLQASLLKSEFQSNYQSLIHGDMHTGSILVKDNSFKYLDPEFACYAPAGFDVGTLLGNMLLALINFLVTGTDSESDEKYAEWLESSISDMVLLFYKKSRKILVEESVDHMAKCKGFVDAYLDKVMQDTAGNCGVEMLRRIIGFAKVRDITSITDLEKRIIAERTGILAAKYFIIHRNEFKNDGSSYLKIIHKIFKSQTNI